MEMVVSGRKQFSLVLIAIFIVSLMSIVLVVKTSTIPVVLSPTSDLKCLYNGQNQGLALLRFISSQTDYFPPIGNIEGNPFFPKDACENNPSMINKKCAFAGAIPQGSSRISTVYGRCEYSN